MESEWDSKLIWLGSEFDREGDLIRRGSWQGPFERTGLTIISGTKEYRAHSALYA